MWFLGVMAVAGLVIQGWTAKQQSDAMDEAKADAKEQSRVNKLRANEGGKKTMRANSITIGREFLAVARKKTQSKYLNQAAASNTSVTFTDPRTPRYTGRPVIH